MPPAQPALTVDQLRTQIRDGDVDTVVVAFTDMQGRLQGKRIHAQFFLDTVLEHGTEGCNYLLAVDVDMNTVDGYAISSWERGYGDMEFVPRPGHAAPGALAARHRDGALRPGLAGRGAHAGGASARGRSCGRRSSAPPTRGWWRYAGTELEFIVFNDTYEQAWDAGYRDLTPANQYNVDYSLLGTGRVEPLLRAIRNDMSGAGLVVESAKGECNLGQHEIAFKYDEVVRTADHHSVYKNGAKEIAAQQGKALTFMAKFDEREGNSCHIHMSLRGTDGGIVFDEGDGPTPMFQQLRRRHPGHDVRASPCSTRRTSTPTSGSRRAPSRRRPPPGATTTAPARCAWSATAPGCGWRTGCPAATSTPTWRWPAMLAGGLRGIEQELELEPAFDRERLRVRPPARCRRRCATARDLFAASAIAREAFGDEVVDHYVNNADVELAAFDAAVTDWERFRGFERM